jgi:YD repeat-containing protein
MRKFYAKLLSYGIILFSFLILTTHTKAQQSLYNGQIPISVPLHTVDNGRVQVPIRLDYDGSGVKPNQHPGWAGMNWNLSAGGAVVREVKGIPDDFYHWTSVIGPDNIPVNHSEIYGRAVVSDLFGDLVFPYTKTLMEGANNAKMPIYLGQGGQQTNDLENDVFRFILPNGNSGEFYLKSMTPETWILKGNKKFKVELIRNATGPLSANRPNLLTYLMTCPLTGLSMNRLQVMDKTTTEKKMMPNRERVDIVPIDNYANSFCFIGFKITTDDGTVYTFGGNDAKNIQFSKPFFQQHSSHWQADAWYLVKIVSSDGEEITLTYNDDLTSDVVAANPNATKYINNMALSRNDTKFYDCANRGDCSSSERPDVILDPNKDGVYTGILIKPTYLKQIDSKTETINFVRTPTVELEYDYKVYEKYFDYFIQNMTFAAYTYTGQTTPLKNDYQYTWCPYLGGNVANYPNLGGLTKEQYLKQNWTNNLTFYKLSEVQVISKKDANGEVLKYSLNYNNDTKSYPGTHYETDRLILQSVNKIANNKKLSYSFDYDTRIALPTKYVDPNGLVDHWGFLNNKIFNLETENTDVRYWSDYYFAREATLDEPTALAGSLKSIKLPTGGKIKYLFEQNKHTIGYGFSSNSPDASGNRISGGLRIASVENEDEAGVVTGKVNYKYVYNFKQSGSGNISSGQRDARIDYYIHFKNSIGTNYIYENQQYNRRETFNSKGRVLLAGATLSTPPVNYSEVTIENVDKSYSILKFTNFFKKDGTSWIEDEDIQTDQRLQNRVTTIDLNPQEPIISRAFERGLILFEENYGSNDLIVSKKEYTYGDITPRATEFTFSVDTRSYPGKTDSQTNWGAVALKAVITTFIPYSSAIDFVFTALGIDWGPSTSTVQIRSTNFGYVYKVYTNLYGLKSDKTYVYDLKDATRTVYTTTTNDYNYNQFGTIGNLNEVITTLPIDNYENNKSKKVELISKTKFASDYGSSNMVCNQYAIGIYETCIGQGRTRLVCADERDAAVTACTRNLESSIGALEQLKTKNMLSYPVENITQRKLTNFTGTTVTSTSTSTLSGNVNLYKNFSINSQLVPMLYESYSLANNSSLSNITLSEIQLGSGNRPTFTYSDRYNIKNLKIEGYDTKGNPNKITSRSGITQNINYDSFNYPSTQSIDNAPVAGGSGVGSSSFTFEHLKGLKSSTDDNGKVISYAYDGFNRLKTVADNEGNILRSYAYNLPFSSPSDATKADVASTTERSINGFTQLAECLPEKSVCDIESKIKPFNASTSCSTGQIKLEFDPEGTSTGTGVKYLWTGPNKFKSTELSPVISENLLKASGIYTLAVTKTECKSTASATVEILIDCNCAYTINTTGTTTDNLTCGTDIGATIKLVANCVGCSGEIVAGQETLVANGNFNVPFADFSCDYDRFMVTNPRDLGTPFRSFGDHTSGNGNMVMLGHSETPNLRLYYITVNNLKPNTRYQVAGWLAAATDNNPNKMFFEIDGNRLPEEISFATSQGGIWRQLKSIWTTGANQTSVTLAIRKQSTVGWNWICLDDISLTEAPKPEFLWTGPNDFSSTLRNPEIINSTAKNSGDYILSVMDKNCVRSAKVKITVTCPLCTQPITVIAGSNSPVSSGGVIKLTSSTEDGVNITWFGQQITNLNKNLLKPEIPIDWIVKDGGEVVRYSVEGYKNGCADNTYVDVTIIKNIIPPGKLGSDLALRIRREDGLSTIEAGETARFCVDVNNVGPNHAYDVTFRVVIPPCLEVVDLYPNGTIGNIIGPEWDFSTKMRGWFNPATRELSNMCGSSLSQIPPFTDINNCWQNRGAYMGGDWGWNNWAKPSAADLMNFSPHTFTKSMCLNLRATQKARFVFKGEVMSVRSEGYEDITDPDSFAGDGVDNGQDDRAEFILNDGYDNLTVSKDRFAVGNKNIPAQSFNVSTLRSGWTISLEGNNTSWITVTPISATGSNGTLKTTPVQFTIADNNNTFSRYLTIVVKSVCGDEKRINVKQAGSTECPSGLVATATSPVICGNTIQLGASIKPIQEVNIIDNSDFESGNIGFSSEGWSNYNGTTGTRAYTVNENPKSVMWFTRASCPGSGDVNSGLGKMMGVSASWTKQGAFWSQSVNVDKGTDYDLAVKAVQLGNYDAANLTLEFYVNGTPTGVKGTISTIGCTWSKILGKWYSGEFFGPVTLSLRFTNPTQGEKMFAIDDLSMNLSKNGRVSDEATASYSWKGPDADPTRLKPASGFTSSIQNPSITNAAYKHDGVYTVTATRSGCSVTSQVAVNIDCPTNVCVAPTVTTSPANGLLCANLNQSVTLTVGGCTGTVFWTDNPTAISANPRTVTLTAIGTYTYKARCVSNCGMSPDSPPATVIVRGVPASPTLNVASPLKICPNGAFTVTATGCTTGTINWSSNYPGSVTRTGTSYTLTDGTNISVTNPVTLSVTCVDACGTSSIRSLNANIENFLSSVTPVASVDKPRLCKNGGAVSLSASGCPAGTEYKWYRVVPGSADVNIGNTNPIAVTVLVSTNFKVRCEQSTCQGPFSSPVGVNVRTNDPPAPSTPTLAANQPATICAGTTITIYSTGCSEANNTLVWSTGAIGVATISWSSAFSGSYDISAKCVSDIGCESAKSGNLTITIPQGPPAPSEPCLSQDPGCASATICKGYGTVIYGGACAIGQTSAWYSSTDNVNFTKMTGFTTGNITVTPTQTTYYKVACENSCSVGAFAIRKLTVNVVDKPAKPLIVSPAVDMVASSPSCGAFSIYSNKGACEGAGFSLKWYKNDVEIPNETSWNYNATTSGTYKARCVNNNNPTDCKESLISDGRIVYIETTPSTPSLSVSSNVCGSKVLTSSSCGAGLIYRWYNVDTEISGVTGQTYTVTSSSTYSVKCVNNSNLYCKESLRSDNQSVTIRSATVAPTISSNVTSVCANTLPTLTATGCAGGTITWSNGSTGITIRPTVTANTTFTATCNDGTCVSGNSNSITVSLTTTGCPGDICSANVGNGNGGDAAFSATFAPLQVTGSLTFNFDPQTVPDQLLVGKSTVSNPTVINVINTGCVGGTGVVTRSANFVAGDIITVQVVPNCNGTTGTAWSFTSSCGPTIIYGPQARVAAVSNNSSSYILVKDIFDKILFESGISSKNDNLETVLKEKGLESGTYKVEIFQNGIKEVKTIVLQSGAKITGSK